MKHLLILILITTHFYSLAMEAPIVQPLAQEREEQEIPASIKTKYDQEKRKFERYNLDNSEKFLDRTRKQLKKSDDLGAYAANLQILASKLLLQHIIIQEIAQTQYIIKNVAQLRKEFNELAKNIGISFSGKSASVKPPTQKHLIELLNHSKMFKDSAREFTPDELTIIIDWFLNFKNDPWMSAFAYSMIMIQDILLQEKLQADIEKKIAPLETHLIRNNMLETQKKIPLAQENTHLLITIIQNLQSLMKKQEKLPQAVTSNLLAKDFDTIEQNASDLYFLTQNEYIKLYEIIYKELKETVFQLMKSNPQNTALKNYLFTIPQDFSSSVMDIPKLLPAHLSPLKNPHDFLVLPSLTPLLNKSMQEWRKAHPEEQEKTIPVPIQESPPAPQSVVKSCPIIQTPKPLQSAGKIKEASDGSYILENEETDKHITIHDPKNNTTIKLFKTDNPFAIKEKLPAKNYTDWAQMWFKNPDQALIVQGYTNINSPKFTAVSQYWRPIAIHSFPLLVDDYIIQWGTLATIPSRRDKTRKDFLVTIPGAMKYPDGTEETGVFAYLIDSRNGQWYHRMFEPQSGTKLIHDLFELGYFSPDMKGYYDVYFPPLGKK